MQQSVSVAVKDGALVPFLSSLVTLSYYSSIIVVLGVVPSCLSLSLSRSFSALLFSSLLSRRRLFASLLHVLSRVLGSK